MLKEVTLLLVPGKQTYRISSPEWSEALWERSPGDTQGSGASAPQSTQQQGDHSPWEEGGGQAGCWNIWLGGDTTRFPLHFPSSSHFSNTSPHLTSYLRSFSEMMPIGSLQYYKVNLTALHIWELRQRSGIWKTCPASYILTDKTRPHP